MDIDIDTLNLGGTILGCFIYAGLRRVASAIKESK